MIRWGNVVGIIIFAGIGGLFGSWLGAMLGIIIYILLYLALTD